MIYSALKAEAPTNRALFDRIYSPLDDIARIT